jgi:hypothetical protein
MTKDEQIIVPRVRTDLLCESIEHLKLTPSKQEFAKAVLRRAVEYAAMREAGLVPMSDQEPVAWLITWRDGETAVWMEKPIPNPEITVQPLYLGAAQTPDRWTAQDLAEAKAEAKELHDYFHPAQEPDEIKDLVSDVERAQHSLAATERANDQMQAALEQIRDQAATKSGAWAAGIATLCLATLGEASDEL